MSRNGATMDELAIEGCAIRVRVEGQDTKPALVLSHMLGTDLTLWDDLVPELTRHFRVVRYDARGHGGSGLGDTPVTLARLGGDVVAILDELGIERAHFCGLSMGGAVGLWLLAHAPGRIERAVIAGSAAKLGEPAVWNPRIAAALADGMEQAIEPTIERWFSPGFIEHAPEPVEAVRALLRATTPAGYAACCAALRDMDLREAVRGVANPVLVLRGTDDTAATAEGAGHLVESMEHATAVEVEARHCVAIEAEAAFTAAVVKFLTARSAPRGTSRRPAPKPSATRNKPAETRSKPSARRVGNRGLVAARQPVARTAPVSGKAVAKANAARKTAARAAPPASTSRRVAAKPPRATGPKAASREAAKLSSAKPGKAQQTSRAKSVSGKAGPATKRVPTPARHKASATAKPPTAAALRAARTKAAVAPGRRAASKAVPAPARAKAARSAAAGTAKAATAGKGAGARTKAGTAVAKKPAAKVSATKKPAAKVPAAKAPATKTQAASRRATPAAAKPRRSPGRGAAGSGRRKP